jgi:hypothetical protein
MYMREGAPQPKRAASRPSAQANTIAPKRQTTTTFLVGGGATNEFNSIGLHRSARTRTSQAQQ